MEARYLTGEPGERICALIDTEEYERLREIEDEMAEVRRHDDALPWERAKQLRRRGEL